MTDALRNDLTIYDTVAGKWWSDEIRWVRTLRNLVPARLACIINPHNRLRILRDSFCNALRIE